MNILNRLRNSLNWRSGAKQVSVDAVIPLIAVPMLTLIAAQNVYLTLIVFLITPILVYHLHHNFLRFLQRSKFFLMWTITSVIMLMLVFELSVVPLLEINPEENIFFMAGVIGGIFFGHKTRTKAEQYINIDNNINDDSELGINENPNGNGNAGGSNDDFCLTCKKKILPKAHHCRTCQICIPSREYHCRWLDCCIGASNLKWYLSCLFCSSLAFIFGSNLTMTTVCHPFIFIGTILLPDNCSDVYQQLDLALCFVSAVYSLFIGLIVVYYLLYHLWLIYLGTTANERRILSTETQF